MPGPARFCQCLTTRSFADAKWLATSFFQYYSEALADIALTNPADVPFLTQDSMDSLDWHHHPQHSSWKHSVQSALQRISLEDHFKIAKQRYPQALHSVGIYTAGESSTLLDILDKHGVAVHH